MKPLLILLALFAGTLIPIQAGLNASLKNAIGHPLSVSLVNFLIGALVLGVVVALLRLGVMPPAGSVPLPWWLWLGGTCGAAFVTVSVICARPLGPTALVGLTVAGQLVAALVIDHFGLLGYVQHSVTPMRLAGAVVLVVGVVMMRS